MNSDKEQEFRACFKRFRENVAADSCPICCEEKPNVITVCCGKGVCITCMATWLSKKESCPQCRAQISFNPISSSPSETIVDNLTITAQRISELNRIRSVEAAAQRISELNRIIYVEAYNSPPESVSRLQIDVDAFSDMIDSFSIPFESQDIPNPVIDRLVPALDSFTLPSFTSSSTNYWLANNINPCPVDYLERDTSVDNLTEIAQTIRECNRIRFVHAEYDNAEYDDDSPPVFSLPTHLVMLSQRSCREKRLRPLRNNRPSMRTTSNTQPLRHRRGFQRRGKR